MTADLDEITKVDTGNLYHEETFTDLKVATIQKLSPIKTDGSPDSSRQVVFSGRTNILTQMGPMPVNCELPGPTLKEAIDAFPEAIKKAVEEMAEEARKMMAERQSSIVVPKPGAGMVPGAGGGGNIQMP